MSAPTVDRTVAERVAAAVPDPELPMVTIGQLGILRGVDVEGEQLVVTITPTYSGCPAMREIAADVQHRLERAGFTDVAVRFRLSPPWTTEWISDDGRRALAEHGVAPPQPVRTGPVRLQLDPRVDRVACPRCGSTATVVTAPFSGTACKALHRCQSCREPFEYVKPI